MCTVNGEKFYYGGRVEACYIKDMLEHNYTPRQMFHKKNQLKVSLSQIRRWWRHFVIFGEIPSITKRKEEILNKMYRKRKSKVTPSIESALIKLIEKEPLMHLDFYAVQLFKQFNVKLSLSTIHYIMKRKGYTLKVIERIAWHQDNFKRQRFLNEIKEIDNKYQFVFIDETSHDKNSSRKRRAYTRKGMKIVMKELFGPAAPRANYTMMGVMDANGFMENCCRIIPKPETVDSNIFLKFLEENIKPILNPYDERNLPHSVIIMDNASVHSKFDIELLLKETGVRIIWTAPYSPDLHPIERAFHQYKERFRALEKSFMTMWEKHCIALKVVTDKNVANYMNGMWGRFGDQDDDASELELLLLLLL